MTVYRSNLGGLTRRQRDLLSYVTANADTMAGRLRLLGAHKVSATADDAEHTEARQ